MSHAHDLTTTQDFVQRVLMKPVATQNVLATVADNVDRLLKQMSFVINQLQSLCYEKEKCLKLVYLFSFGTFFPTVFLDVIDLETYKGLCRCPI